MSVLILVSGCNASIVEGEDLSGQKRAVVAISQREDTKHANNDWESVHRAPRADGSDLRKTCPRAENAITRVNLGQLWPELALNAKEIKEFGRLRNSFHVTTLMHKATRM
jgi:hypothetical protein